MSTREVGRHLVGEAIATLTSNPARSLISSAAIVLGVSAFLGGTALASSGQASIEGRLERIAVTTVVATLDLQQEEDPRGVLARAERNVERLQGVTEVGVSVVLRGTDVGSVRTQPAAAVAGGARRETPVLAVSAKYLVAANAVADAGALAEFGRGGQVAVIGRAVAIESDVRPPEDVLVGGRAFASLAVASSNSVDARARESVIIPFDAAASLFGLDAEIDEAVLLIRTRVGSATPVAALVRTAAWPTAEDGKVTVAVQSDPRVLRESVTRDALRLVRLTSVALMLIAAFTIASTMLTSVLQRSSEIGLRRALGASRRAIRRLILIEAGLLGFAGGTVGALLGVGTAVGVALANGWPVAVDPLMVAVSPLVGTVVGVVAGLYPGVRAARLDPAVAVRGGL